MARLPSLAEVSRPQWRHGPPPCLVGGGLCSSLAPYPESRSYLPLNWCRSGPQSHQVGWLNKCRLVSLIENGYFQSRLFPSMWKLLLSFLNKHFGCWLWHTLGMVCHGFWALSWIRVRMVGWSKTKIPAHLSSLGGMYRAVAFPPAKALQAGVLPLSSPAVHQQHSLLNDIDLFSAVFSAVLEVFQLK